MMNVDDDKISEIKSLLHIYNYVCFIIVVWLLIMSDSNKNYHQINALLYPSVSPNPIL